MTQKMGSVFTPQPLMTHKEIEIVSVSQFNMC